MHILRPQRIGGNCGNNGRIDPTREPQDYYAMVLSLRDYMRKTGFSSALLGLSGGIDSAIVATIAADALGPQNVHCATEEAS